MNKPMNDWSETLAANQQAFFKAMLSPWPSTAGAPDASAPLMQQQFTDLQQTWKESIEKWTDFVKEGADPKSLTPKALREMFAPMQWSGPATGADDASLRQVIEGPKYAVLWDLDRKLAELQLSAQRRDRAVATFQAVVQRAWNNALKQFVNSFGSSKAEQPSTWRGLTDRWLQVANETLIEAHRSNEFIEAQTGMLRTASDYRLQERKLAEAWCEACHIPTRSEVDELQRTVIELKRELRLQRRRAEPRDAPLSPAAQPRTTRTPSAKSRRPALA